MKKSSFIKDKIKLLEKISNKKVRLVEATLPVFKVTRDEVYPVTLRYSYEVEASSEEEAKRKVDKEEFLSRDFVEQLTQPEEEKPSEVKVYKITQLTPETNEPE